MFYSICIFRDRGREEEGERRREGEGERRREGEGERGRGSLMVLLKL